jgi:nitronate monooxygenase
MTVFPLSFYLYLLFIWQLCVSAANMSRVDELQRALPWVQTPIIANGPMGFGIAGGDLAAAVTRAGGLGQVGFISNRTEMEHQLDIAKSQLEDAMVNNTNSATLPIGMVRTSHGVS